MTDNTFGHRRPVNLRTMPASEMVYMSAADLRNALFDCGYKLLDRKNVQKMLGICESSLISLVKTGELKEIRVGKSPKYRPEDVKKYIDSL